MNIIDVDKILPEENEQAAQEEQMQMQKFQAELAELTAKVEKLQSETQLNYAKIESEYGGQRKTMAGIGNDERKLDINDVINFLVDVSDSLGIITGGSITDMKVIVKINNDIINEQQKLIKNHIANWKKYMNSKKITPKKDV